MKLLLLWEKLLHQYAGSVICVSHDRELLDAYANRIIEIQNDGTIWTLKEVMKSLWNQNQLNKKGFF